MPICLPSAWMQANPHKRHLAHAHSVQSLTARALRRTVARMPQTFAPDTGAPLGLDEYSQMVEQLHAQPPWRAQADKCADYADGNQLDEALLRRQQELGMAPAKLDIIGPVIRSICGYEAKTRTDWRVTADGGGADDDGADIAAALNFELNQAERHSGADRALSGAFRSMLVGGIGWVEVVHAPSSLQYPYQCRAVHRNEIFWDMQAQEADLRDARWLLRRRWVDAGRAAHMFPAARQVLLTHGLHAAHSFADLVHGSMLEGGVSTALKSAPDAARAWTRAEEQWCNRATRQVCISEVWYRRWVPVHVLVWGAGLARRAVVFEKDNPAHQALLQSGQCRLQSEVQTRVRRAYWIGPYCLNDAASPYAHGKFPYVALFGWREDMTAIPYGLVRAMLFPQDCLNNTYARLNWGLTAVQMIRTQGAALMDDEQLRRTVAMRNADIVLDAQHMMQEGARFEIKHDFALNTQHFQLITDAKAAVRDASGVTSAFEGRAGSATSGLQEQTQVEQSQVALAELFDNFKAARSEVGELLLAQIIADLGDAEHAVHIGATVFAPPRRVVLNRMEADPQTGTMRRRMHVRAQRLRVALEDVPTSSSFRAQQLNSLTEVAKSAPPEVQKVILPYMLELMPMPHKKEIIEQIRQASARPDPAAVQAQALQEAKAQLQHDLKERELQLKERQWHMQAQEGEARIAKLVQQAVREGVAAMQQSLAAAAHITQAPQIAPVADAVLAHAAATAPEMAKAPEMPQMPPGDDLPQPETQTPVQPPVIP